ncbi:hypothetical protein LTR09_000654 [Extremus antarcticus]|uniref:RBR-type E3 ubiquitin transferase n=1 Tax=Extremus antarcticus TaxID=702011 RepID=A0AAJ0GK65_9PEZI|nr:hypothetical protein LTR09_000654 [Extremus antarcticus]
MEIGPQAPPTFDCAICLETRNGHGHHIAHVYVCRPCIIEHILPKFHAALEHEAKYPVKWSGDVELQPKDFAQYFPDYSAFFTKWHEKVKEYSTPRQKRVHCKGCESFVRERARHSGEGVAWCKQCRSLVCGNCGDPGHSARRCDVDTSVASEEEPIERLPGHNRCPNVDCRAPMYLYDGCNHVRCGVCKLSFCWVCLKKNPGDGHWTTGNSCPRFGQPGSRRAIFDEDVEVGFREGIRWLLGAARDRMVHTARRALLRVGIPLVPRARTNQQGAGEVCGAGGEDETGGQTEEGRSGDGANETRVDQTAVEGRANEYRNDRASAGAAGDWSGQITIHHATSTRVSLTIADAVYIATVTVNGQVLEGDAALQVMADANMMFIPPQATGSGAMFHVRGTEDQNRSMRDQGLAQRRQEAAQRWDEAASRREEAAIRWEERRQREAERWNETAIRRREEADRRYDARMSDYDRRINERQNRMSRW